MNTKKNKKKFIDKFMDIEVLISKPFIENKFLSIKALFIYMIILFLSTIFLAGFAIPPDGYELDLQLPISSENSYLLNLYRSLGTTFVGIVYIPAFHGYLLGNLFVPYNQSIAIFISNSFPTIGTLLGILLLLKIVIYFSHFIIYYKDLE